MSRRYFDDPHRSARRPVIIELHQPSDSSSRRNVPPPSRDFNFQSTFQPNREGNPPPPPRHHHGEYSHSDGYPNSTRSSFNQMNNASNDRPHRRYQLEAPSTRSHVRQPHSYHNEHQDVSHSTDHHYDKSRQPVINRSSVSQPYRYDQDYPRHERNSDQYDRRHHREETPPSRSDLLHSNHRSVAVLSPRQYSNPVRSLDDPFSQSSRAVQRHHPASLLTNILQNVFGGHGPSLNDADSHHDDDHSPLGLIVFAFAMQRPDGVVVPSGFHIQFGGDIFDLLAHEETPSVGLSDSDIERIPTMTYRKRTKSKSTDDKCAICLSEYKTGETVKRLRCKHFFHPECIDPWLKTSTQCPICRGAQTD